MCFRPLHLALAVAAFAVSLGARATAMTFEAIKGPDECIGRTCILAAGEIDAQTVDDFQAFLKAGKIARGALVVLNSGGGNLVESLRLGNVIRQAGLSTTVRSYDPETGRFQAGGTCASGCAYAFLGGVSRSVGEGGRIGVHQIYTQGDAWALSAQDGLELMSLVAAHIRRLGASLELLIPAMNTRPQGMHWLSTGELSRYAVVTATTAQG